MFLLLEKSHAGTVFKLEEILPSISWDSRGLIAVVAQQYNTGEVLMLAWMNQLALEEKRVTGHVHDQACGGKARPLAVFSGCMISVWIAKEMPYFCLLKTWRRLPHRAAKLLLQRR